MKHNFERAGVMLQFLKSYIDGDSGVTLMNDCKYGHDIQDGVMRLTLLKCATYPKPDSDKGNHQFTYSLYAHKGNV